MVNVPIDKKFSFGFSGWGTGDISNGMPTSSQECTSGRGHCWHPTHKLLCYPPIHVYKCEHCPETKQVQEKLPDYCKVK
jgi:hypothetical protein